MARLGLGALRSQGDGAVVTAAAGASNARTGFAAACSSLASSPTA